MATDLLIARTTASIRLKNEGRTVRIRKGVTVVRADDPAVKGRESLFRPLVVTPLGTRAPTIRRPVNQRRTRPERATAAPGEPRTAVDTSTGTDPDTDDTLGDDQDTDPATGGEQGTDPAEPTAREVRAWAREQDPPIEVPARGKLPDEVMTAWRRAHGGAW